METKRIDVCFGRIDAFNNNLVVEHREINVPKSLALTFENVDHYVTEYVHKMKVKHSCELKRLYEAARNRYDSSARLSCPTREFDSLEPDEKMKYGYDPLSEHFKQYDTPQGRILSWSRIDD